MIRNMEKHKKYFVILVLGATAIRIAFLTKTPIDIVAYHQDDAFFYHEIARNAVQGNVFVISEGIQTNGFHPLYAILLTGIHSLSMYLNLGLYAPIYLTVLINSIISIVTAIILYYILRELHSSYAGVIAGSLWLSSSYVLSIYLEGMEISLQILFLSLLVYYICTNIGEVAPSVKQSVIIGILIGAVFLSRMDGAFIAIGLAVTLLRPYKFKKKLINKKSLVSVIIIASVSLFISMPWFIYSITELHRLTPISGEAARLTQANTGFVTNIFEVFYALGGAMTQTVISVDPLFGRSILGMASSAVVLILSLIIPTLYSMTHSRKSIVKILNKIDFLIVASALYYSYYLLYQNGVRRYYLLFTAFVTVIAVSIVVPISINELDSNIIKKVSVSLFSLVIIMNLAVGSSLLYSDPPREHLSTKVEQADWVNQNIPQEYVMGVDNGGVIQYFTDADVIVLDSVINPEHLEYYKKNKMSEYLNKSNITYIINPTWKKYEKNQWAVVESWRIETNNKYVTVKRK
jgi:hypothetical protein